MHVVVVGCGRVGSSLAHALIASDHTVSVIDRKTDAFRRLGPDFAGTAVKGVGFDRDVLIRAGIERADAVASVTSGDNSNILIARVAKEAFGVKRVVARIYDARRASFFERLGIPTIATTAWTSERVLNRILGDAHIGEWIDPSAKFTMIERIVGSEWAAKRVDEFEAAAHARIALLTRLGAPTLATSSMLLQEGDILHAMIANADAARIESLLA